MEHSFFRRTGSRFLALLGSLYFFTTLAIAAPPILLEIDEPTTGVSPGQIVLSSGWTTKNTNYTGSRGGQENNCNYAGGNFQRRGTAYLDDYASCGEGYGLPGGGTNEWMTLTLPATNTFQSVSAFFLFHRTGQIADIFVDGTFVTNIDTFAVSGRPYASIAAQIREVVIATGLAPGAHTIRVVDTGRISHSNRNETNAEGRGLQVAMDCFRLGDFNFGGIRGTLTDRFGAPIPHAKLMINTNIGPLLDTTGTQTLFYTDGAGRYSLAGLTRGNTYTLSVLDRALSTTQNITIPSSGDGTLVLDLNGNNTININRPRMGIPTMAAKGSTFEIEADAASTATSWVARLKNTHKTVTLPISSSVYGPTQIWNKTRPGWLITVTVPATAPQELWNLELQCQFGGTPATRVETSAVSISDGMNQSFYLGHLTDCHLKSPREFIRYINAIKAMSVISPQAITMSGDLIDIHSHAQAYDNLLEMSKNSEVPLLFGPGNHDLQNTDTFTHELWNRCLAQHYFSTRMGPTFFLSHNNTINTNTWATGEWDQSYANVNDKNRIIMQHIYGDSDPGFSFYPVSKPANLLIFGHWHSDSSFLVNGVRAVVTVDTSSSYPIGGKLFRFNKDGVGNWSLGNYGYPNNTSSASIPLVNSDTVINVSRSFQLLNNGSLSSNTVTILNGTREPFEHGRARFIMDKGHYTVSSGPGLILDQYDSDDGSKTIVLTKINVAAAPTVGSTNLTSVTIFRDSGAPPPPTTASFREGTNGYTGTLDTYIDGIGAATTNSFGTANKLEIRKTGTTEDMRSLLRFDIASIPTNAQVVGARLTVYCTRASGCSAADVLLLDKATSSWTESHTFSMGVPTTTSSGVTMPSVAGYTTTNPPPVYVISDGLETLVQSWISNPAQNLGMLLTSSTPLNFAVASSEHTTVGLRPMLEVDYRLPGNTPPTVLITSPTASSFVTNDIMSVTGQASDNSSVSSVLLNSKPVTSADAFANWSCIITNSVGGTNTLIAIATDDASAQTTNQVQFVYLDNSFDSNGDLIPDRWQVTHFGFGFLLLPQAAASADPDGDGQTNLAEHRAGTSPLDPSSRYVIQSQYLPALNQFSITWKSVAGKTYIPQWSDNMVTWTDITSPPITASGPTTTWVDTDGSATDGNSPAVRPKRFYRVKTP